YLFYQALLGVWPCGEVSASALQDLKNRMRAYMTKAIREAKRHTSWIAPNQTYENGVLKFFDLMLAPRPESGFLQMFIPFGERIAQAGMINSLSQVVLKVASPGVSDFYQGCELWDFSLVDPDNRRPVDFAARRRMLQELHAPEVSELIANW